MVGKHLFTKIVFLQIFTFSVIFIRNREYFNSKYRHFDAILLVRDPRVLTKDGIIER